MKPRLTGTTSFSSHGAPLVAVGLLVLAVGAWEQAQLTGAGQGMLVGTTLVSSGLLVGYLALLALLLVTSIALVATGTIVWLRRVASNDTGPDTSTAGGTLASAPSLPGAASRPLGELAGTAAP